MKIIDGRALAKVIKDKIVLDIKSLNGPRPGLAIILVGERADSALYVGLKEKQAKEVGIDTHVYRCDEDITEEQMLKMIDFLNKDKEVDAILVQLPLPKNLNTNKIVNTIAPEKDVDGFTEKNLAKLMDPKQISSAIMPPVYGVIFAMLSSLELDLRNKKIVIIGNSEIFEGNLAEILKRQGAETVLADKKDPNLKTTTLNADIIITAIGQAGYLTGEMLKPHSVIIDIGISTMADGSITGDVKFSDTEKMEGYITPVPGGVGPMTIAMAFWNTLEMFKKHRLK